ncbi:unnamed protein product, partial [Amoebophrya sp. A25]|eukprot:GSA25T00021272001.1
MQTTNQNNLSNLSAGVNMNQMGNPNGGPQQNVSAGDVTSTSSGFGTGGGGLPQMSMPSLVDTNVGNNQHPPLPSTATGGCTRPGLANTMNSQETLPSLANNTSLVVQDGSGTSTSMNRQNTTRINSVAATNMMQQNTASSTAVTPMATASGLVPIPPAPLRPVSTTPPLPLPPPVPEFPPAQTSSFYGGGQHSNIVQMQTQQGNANQHNPTGATQQQQSGPVVDNNATHQQDMSYNGVSALGGNFYNASAQNAANKFYQTGAANAAAASNSNQGLAANCVTPMQTPLQGSSGFATFTGTGSGMLPTSYPNSFPLVAAPQPPSIMPGQQGDAWASGVGTGGAANGCAAFSSMIHNSSTPAAMAMTPLHQFQGCPASMQQQQMQQFQHQQQMQQFQQQQEMQQLQQQQQLQHMQQLQQHQHSLVQQQQTQHMQNMMAQQQAYNNAPTSAMMMNSPASSSMLVSQTAHSAMPCLPTTPGIYQNPALPTMVAGALPMAGMGHVGQGSSMGNISTPTTVGPPNYASSALPPTNSFGAASMNNTYGNMMQMPLAMQGATSAGMTGGQQEFHQQQSLLGAGLAGQQQATGQMDYNSFYQSWDTKQSVTNMGGQSDGPLLQHDIVGIGTTNVLPQLQSTGA